MPTTLNNGNKYVTNKALLAIVMALVIVGISGFTGFAIKSTADSATIDSENYRQVQFEIKDLTRNLNEVVRTVAVMVEHSRLKEGAGDATTALLYKDLNARLDKITKRLEIIEGRL